MDGANVGGERRSLRFGVMCNGEELTAWQVRSIEALLEIEGVEPALLIVKEPERAKAGPAPRKRRGKLLWRLYSRFMLRRKSVADALQPLLPALRGLPIQRCSVEKQGAYAERLREADLEAIRAHDLDFILRYGFGILRGPVLDLPRFGVWSFHHGDPDKYRGMPPGFWEIYNGEAVTGSVLQRLTERLDAGVILQSGHFKNEATSYVRSRDRLYFETSSWPARVCRDILRGTADYLGRDPLRTDAPITREPTNGQMLRFAWRRLKGWFANQHHFLFRHQQWGVGIIDAPVQAVAGLTGAGRPLPVQWLAEPPGRFLADPFAVEQEEKGDLLLIAEDYHWKAAKGRISSVQLTGERVGEPQLLFDLPFHMSYPYLFRHEGRLFCVPETSEAGEVRLYVLDERTLEPRLDRVLISGRRLVDGTIFQHEGRWWLLATDEANGANDKLHAWMAPDLRGPWTEHPANPIKTDPRSSRPAGRPFVHDGRLYRPGQDCSRVYGGAVAINRIVELTPDRFEEMTVHLLKPQPGWRYTAGLHTLCAVGDRTVIDACRESFVPAAFAAAIARKLQAVLGKLGRKPG